MQSTYYDLQASHLENSDEFEVNEEGNLMYYNIDVMELIKQYGTPLRITYLPKISENIEKAKIMFNVAFAKYNYTGKYTYCYCTKSSHFKFVLDEVLKHDVHIETSSAYDIPIIQALQEEGSLTKDHYIICNGFKREEYLSQVSNLINNGFHNTISVLDNVHELEYYKKHNKNKAQVGIRIATEETPNFNFYTSRLGMNPSLIVDYYKEHILNDDRFSLKMLHFFINTGIKDHVYYWNELEKCLKLYVELKKIAPELDSLNIGGGFPFKSHLAFDYDYAEFTEKIIRYIKETCDEAGIQEPNIFTEFGTFTVAESGAMFYQIIDQKQQNDRERWYMINNSFMTTLPDIWALDQRFIMLPINRWYKKYHNVFLGGITCDSMDFYNSDAHNNRIFLPVLEDEDPLIVGFFNVGAYQDSLSGVGGIKHCLIPSPKHVIVDVDEDEEVTTKLFSKEQSAKSMLKILGY